MSDDLPPSSSAQNSRRTGWAIAIAATAGIAVSYADRQTLTAIAPAVRSTLAIDHAQFGWLLSAFSLAYLVGAPFAGTLVDRFGARRCFAIAVVLWSVVAGAHALAATFGMLLVLRLLLGITEAPAFPSATQAVRQALSGKRQPLAFGLLLTGSSIGAMVAAPLAVTLEAHHGFRFAFAATALVGMLWTPVWLYVTRDKLRAEAPAPPARAKPPTSRWVDIATSPAVLRSVVAIAGVAPTILVGLNWASQYLVEHWGLKKGAIGAYLIVPPLLFDLGAVAFGWLASRRKRTESAETSTPRDLVLAAGFLASALTVVPLASSPAIAITMFGAAAFGSGGIYVLATADMLARVPEDRTSSAAGLSASSQSLAQIVASPLIGFVIDRTGGYGSVFVFVGSVAMPAALAFVFWQPQRDKAMQLRPQ